MYVKFVRRLINFNYVKNDEKDFFFLCLLLGKYKYMFEEIYYFFFILGKMCVYGIRNLNFKKL